MPGTGAYLLIGAIAAAVTFVTTPVVVKVARRVGWVVQPDPRRIHKVATPDVGGIAMFIGFVVAFGVARLMDAFDPIFARNSEPRGVLFAAALMFIIGFIDDIREISAPAKMIGTVGKKMVASSPRRRALTKRPTACAKKSGVEVEVA